VKDSKRAQEVENMRSNVDMAKHLDTLKPEMVSTIVLDILPQGHCLAFPLIYKALFSQTPLTQSKVGHTILPVIYMAKRHSISTHSELNSECIVI
jgi:hypothetical protein